MHPVQEAITGKENQGELSSPYQALVQFYCAFNSGNMQMMSMNWAQSDEIAMDNPLGGIKRGWTEMFYAVGKERGYFRLGDEEITLAIRTSRIFQKIGGRWRQVHHHGSIEDSQLLASYQAAVLGTKP